MADYTAFNFLFELAAKASKEGNAHREAYVAATSGKDEAIQSVLNTSDDKKVAEYRDYVARGQAQIEKIQRQLAEAREGILEHAESLAAVSQNGNPDEIKAQYLESRRQYTDAMDTIKSFLKDEAEIAKGVEAHKIAPVVGLGKGASAKGATGIVRPRIASAKIDGEAFADAKGKVTFTQIANRLGIENAEFTKAAFAAAGVESWSDLDPETEVSITLTVKGKEHNVTVVTPASKAKGNTEANESDDNADSAE